MSRQSRQIANKTGEEKEKLPCSGSSHVRGLSFPLSGRIMLPGTATECFAFSEQKPTQPNTKSFRVNKGRASHRLHQIHHENKSIRADHHPRLCQVRTRKHLTNCNVRPSDIAMPPVPLGSPGFTNSSLNSGEINDEPGANIGVRHLPEPSGRAPRKRRCSWFLSVFPTSRAEA